MGAQTSRLPSHTAQDVISAVLKDAPVGSVVSVKATLEAVRRECPQLTKTDCELIELMISIATMDDVFLVFDLHEERVELSGPTQVRPNGFRKASSMAAAHQVEGLSETAPGGPGSARRANPT